MFLRMRYEDFPLHNQYFFLTLSIAITIHWNQSFSDLMSRDRMNKTLKKLQTWSDLLEELPILRHICIMGHQSSPFREHIRKMTWLPIIIRDDHCWEHCHPCEASVLTDCCGTGPAYQESLANHNIIGDWCLIDPSIAFMSLWTAVTTEGNNSEIQSWV